jgi:protein-tyrosine phosphatase
VTVPDDVIVERIDRDRVEICWRSEGQSSLVSIYEGFTPDDIDTVSPVAQTSGESVILQRRTQDGRRYYKVVPQEGSSIIVAERLVPFEQIRNFRDLGGYETASGQTARWGKIYRSAELSRATKADVAHLSSLGIKVIVDLRARAAATDNPDRLPDSGVRLVPLTMDDEEAARWAADVLLGRASDAEAARDRLKQTYVSGIGTFRAETAGILRTMSDPDNLPAVFHCQAGKDRTGRIAALLLTLLGVPYATVLEDYLLTNRYRAALIERRVANHPYPDAVRALVTAREEYLIAFFSAIQSQYGSVERYALVGLGIAKSTLKRLRSLLLSP